MADSIFMLDRAYKNCAPYLNGINVKQHLTRKGQQTLVTMLVI